MSQFRDRIVEVKKIKVTELLDNSGNWRTHPAAQRESMTGILNEVGKADVLLAYYSRRADGKLTLFDGHLRKAIDPNEEWTVAITDLTDEEADKMLLVLDPLAAMAEMDARRVLELNERVNTDDLALREVLRRMELDAQRALNEETDEEGENGKKEKTGPAAMELMPFEHYDYLVLFFRTTFDFERALDFFGVRKTGWYAHMGDSYEKGRLKVGIGRALDGARAMERIAAALDARTNRGDEDETRTASSDTEPQAGETVDGTRADDISGRNGHGRGKRGRGLSPHRSKRKSRAAS